MINRFNCCEHHGTMVLPHFPPFSHKGRQAGSCPHAADTHVEMCFHKCLEEASGRSCDCEVEICNSKALKSKD